MKQAYIITIIYICFSSLYIIFSDQVVSSLNNLNTVQDVAWIQSVKGISFVLASGLLIFTITNYNFKRLEKAMKNSNEYQILSEQIIASSGDAIGLFDEAGCLIMSNNSLRSLLGEQKTEIGKKIDLAQMSNKVLKPFISNFLTQQDDRIEQVFEFTTGSWLKISMTKIKNLDGQSAILFRSQDITEHVLIEQTLRENEMKYLSIFHKQPFGVLLIDGLGKVKFHNDLFMEIMGLKHSRDLRRFWLNAFHDEERRSFKVKWENAELKNSSFTTNLRIADANGQQIWCEVNVVPINEHNYRGLIITVRDITDQILIEEKIRRYSEDLKHEVEMQTAELQLKTTKMEEYQKSLMLLLEDVNEIRKELEVANNLLKMSNNELEAFSYSVSHDLQAPLRSIQGFSEALKEDYGDLLDEKGHDFLDRISNGVHKMAGLINDLLVLSKVSRVEIQKKEIDLNDMVREIVTELQEAGLSKPVNFTIQEGLTCLGDVNLLRILLNNLLQNAIKFTTQTEQPEVIVGKDESGKLFVKDNGVGFDMKYADLIFEPFKRLHSSKLYTGSGIGLTIVRRIVQRHLGEITVVSKPNEGTTFCFRI